jgi:D-beta-D-heptose 7-phosphate kinase/D-beta-D-heptose 1-phosphate adenosyltransferase
MKKLARFIPEFKNQNILIIGDLMLDSFVWGKVSRISQEAPVPVVEVTRETNALGGAGNVANNITSLGGRATVIGVIGDDIIADRMMEELRNGGINTDNIVRDSSRPTITKTRIIAQHQQVVRVDKELKGEFAAGIVDGILSEINEVAADADAIIISDYGKGVINRRVLESAIKLSRRYKVPITVDPKIEHFLSYKKVSCITPNFSEAVAGMRSGEPRTEKDVLELGKKILKALGSESVLITRGEKGMTLFEPGNKITHIPTRAKEVYDVTGAGDTVIAALTLALAAKADYAEAAEISNFAAGIVVGKLGTATVNPTELGKAVREFETRK